ncbi:MAG: ATP-binding cassette domain-containing protein [Sandaracinus sp.]|nr:ATP-binding cassette domain-containing protein [Sandaracinus sp.]
MSGTTKAGGTAETRPSPEAPTAFEALGITHRFGEHVVLEDVSFRVPRGELLCVVGPNGAGKSTLLRVVLGLLRPDAGQVRVDGGTDAIGYVPQRKTLPRGFPARVDELIVANLRGRWPWRIRDAERDALREALGRVGGAALEKKSLAALSGGELQRVYLARALVRKPKLLVLDEPETGVDTHGRHEITELLHALSRDTELAAIVVSHHPEVIARIAQRVLYLDRRVLAWGLPSELFGRAGFASIGDPRLRSTRDAGEDADPYGADVATGGATSSATKEDPWTP